MSVRDLIGIAILVTFFCGLFGGVHVGGHEAGCSCSKGVFVR